MATVLFIYDRVKTPIQCRKEDKIRDICNKFATIDINSLNFIYSGKELNLESTFNEQANIIDRNRNEMIILVEEKNKSKNNIMKKSKSIVCPTCKENCLINMDQYKIKLYECKNCHETNNILLDEFNDTQSIDAFKVCNNCNKIFMNEENNKECNNIFYKCLTCKQDLCFSCKNNHNDRHKIIEYDNKNYICNIHYNKSISYCKECKMSLCEICVRTHNKYHKIINYNDSSLLLEKEEDEIKEKMNNFRKKINKLNDDIKGMIRMLYKIMESIEVYYRIHEEIINNCDKSNPFGIQNINNIKNNLESNDIDDIINENDICNKFQKIMDLYQKMNDKNNDNNNENINEIKLKYKINKIDKKIKLFGKNFINNNKNNCKFIYEEKSYELKEYLDLTIKDEKKILLI